MAILFIQHYWYQKLIFISAIVVFLAVVTLVGRRRRRRPVILEPDPLHGGAGDQVHVSLALEATHLHVSAQSLLGQGFSLSISIFIK